jgi:hypothetical protein
MFHFIYDQVPSCTRFSHVSFHLRPNAVMHTIQDKRIAELEQAAAGYKRTVWFSVAVWGLADFGGPRLCHWVARR